MTLYSMSGNVFKNSRPDCAFYDNDCNGRRPPGGIQRPSSDGGSDCDLLEEWRGAKGEATTQG